MEKMVFMSWCISLRIQNHYRDSNYRLLSLIHTQTLNPMLLLSTW